MAGTGFERWQAFAGAAGASRAKERSLRRPFNGVASEHLTPPCACAPSGERGGRYDFLQVSSPMVTHVPPISASKRCLKLPSAFFVNVSRPFIGIGPICPSPS